MREDPTVLVLIQYKNFVVYDPGWPLELLLNYDYHYLGSFWGHILTGNWYLLLLLTVLEKTELYYIVYLQFRTKSTKIIL